MKKWRCKICGYIHDGDTPPDYCPVCGADSDDFEQIELTNSEQNNHKISRILIIGNGAAGMEAAKSIREKNKSVEILMFTDEPYHFYSRIHLSTFIGDESNPDDIQIYPPQWYEEHNIKVYRQKPIIGIHPEKNEIRDIFGEIHSYDLLIIATGAHPFLPPIKGLSRNGIFVLRNLQNAQTIRKFAGKCRTAVVIGGGILGIEAASSLNKLGLQVTVVEVADHIMPQQLDKNGASVLQHTLENRGIKFKPAIKAREFLGEFQVEELVLESGEKIPADMALIATGIVPNTDLAKEAGIKVNRGIVVNDRLETNYSNIYAAGDVAEHRDIIHGIWPGAVDQGLAAGESALGIPCQYEGSLPLHILKVAGVDMTALGKKYKDNAAESEIVHLDKQSGQYVKLIHDGENLLGAIVVDVKGLGFRLEKMLRRRQSIKEMLPDLEKGNWDVLRKEKKKKVN